MDECDDVFFSNLEWFDKVMANPTVIAFTATPPEAQDTYEEEILADFFGANIIDSQLALKLKDGEKQMEFDEPELISFERVSELIEKRTEPVIVYCTPD